MTTATTKKITIATVKSFVKKNRATLLINVKSRFDGMTDMVEDQPKSDFSPIAAREYWCESTNKMIPASEDNRSHMGILGVWFVNGGGDWCYAFESATHKGYLVSNCCGEWIVAIAK